jgi:hypothetical protein
MDQKILALKNTNFLGETAPIIKSGLALTLKKAHTLGGLRQR